MNTFRPVMGLSVAVFMRFAVISVAAPPSTAPATQSATEQIEELQQQLRSLPSVASERTAIAAEIMRLKQSARAEGAAIQPTANLKTDLPDFQAKLPMYSANSDRFKTFDGSWHIEEGWDVRLESVAQGFVLHEHWQDRDKLSSEWKILGGCLVFCWGEDVFALKPFDFGDKLTIIQYHNMAHDVFKRGMDLPTTIDTIRTADRTSAEKAAANGSLHRSDTKTAMRPRPE